MTGIYLAGSFLAGLLLRDARAGWLGAAVLMAVAVVCCLIRPNRTTVYVSGICLVMLGLGYWRGSSGTGEAPPRLDAHLRYTGQVLDVPRATSSGQSARIRLDHPANLIVLAQLPPIPLFSQGDVIRFSGDISPTSPSTAPARALMATWARNVVVIGNRATWWQRLRTAASGRAVATLTSSIPLPAGALASGVLIGDDSALTNQERDQFRAAGLSHITAVSGWNIALVTGLMMLLHGRIPLPRTPRIGLSILGIWSFTYLTGSEPSAVRAAVMGSLCMIAIWRGRPRDTLTILLWAIALMLFIQPLTRFSLGFQLSVFATLGLVLSMPLMSRCPSWLAPLLVPATAELSVAPVLLHQLGQYSLISPLANLLVAPLIVPLAAGAGATLVAGTVSITAGQAIGFAPWLLGKLVMEVAGLAASIPGGSGKTPLLSSGAMALTYAVLALTYFGCRGLMQEEDQTSREETPSFDVESEA